jgi:hypothetical protein
MCYSVYLSTDSPRDLCVYSTDLIRFQKAEEYAYKVAGLIDLLEFPGRKKGTFYFSKKQNVPFSHTAGNSFAFG